MLDAPSTFINSAPHMTFVRGEKDVAFLKKRYEALKEQPLFAGIEYSEDSRVINSWAPLLMQKRRKGEPFAATRVPAGTDVDFGALTRQLFASLAENGAEVRTNTEVKRLKRLDDGTWRVKYRRSIGRTPGEIGARFVFVGAGGWALKLLQSSGIPEISGYGVFPIGGQFLKTTNPALVAQHKAKVYSQASVGAPPMSVPHLDTRVVDGEASLLFGPFATFSPKFLKNGSMLRPRRAGAPAQPRPDAQGRDRQPVAHHLPRRRAAEEPRQEGRQPAHVHADRQGRGLGAASRPASARRS